MTFILMEKMITINVSFKAEIKHVKLKITINTSHENYFSKYGREFKAESNFMTHHHKNCLSNTFRY